MSDGNNAVTTEENVNPLPFFSIIMPVYNAENRMRKGLDSIKNAMNEYKKIGGTAELIVVCDSCEDNSKTIAEEYTTYVYEVNYNKEGQTRNKGLEMAESLWTNQYQWILFMDDDDWWMHEYVLCKLGKLIQKNDKGNAGALAFSFIWKNLGYIEPVRSDGSYWPMVWNKAWKRAAIEGCRFSDNWDENNMNFDIQIYVKWNEENNQKYIMYNTHALIYYYNSSSNNTTN